MNRLDFVDKKFTQNNTFSHFNNSFKKNFFIHRTKKLHWAGF
jgi:hypothetical protein